ncbi:angiopoietin-2-like [Amblyraja radiata]|uniref:angiopoietin-2-like n=1 Tax=Amblyraja radiata TaxID=386614 RepID=UPI001401F430|nr:angiopoietin-2-like [Amblyraja radiata]
MLSSCLSVVSCVCTFLAVSVYSSNHNGTDSSVKRQHRIQHGPCSYMFLLPEIENCQPSPDHHISNSPQRDSPVKSNCSSKRLQQLEGILDNNKQWLQKVLNQTLRLEIQLLENSLSINKLEKQIMVQNLEITNLQEKNSVLEQKVLEMEGKHESELESMKMEKLEMLELLLKQSTITGELEKHPSTVMGNSDHATSDDQIHQIQKEEPVVFKDCAEVFKSGISRSGIHTLHIPNVTESMEVFCDMETSGGGWTVFQHREDGNVEFHQDWKEYKSQFWIAII